MQDCGRCTLCCKLLRIESTNSIQGEFCQYCHPEKGCWIYEDRPEECRTFLCSYVQMEVVKPEMRPDRCGIVFEKVNDFLILGNTDGSVTDLSPLIIGQLDAFAREGISVVLQKFNPHQFQGYLAPGAKKEEIIQALEDKANDGSKLHRRPK